MKKNFFPKIKASLLVFILLLAFFVTNTPITRAIDDPGMQLIATPIVPVPVPAMPVIDATALSIKVQESVKTSLGTKLSALWKKFGSKLVSTTLRNTLNRVALDAAKYVASAGEGQKATYVIEDFGTYWKNIGDAAAGDFIDGLGEAWSVDLCQPLDPNIQAKISLGLVQTLAPDAPNCTLSNLVNNYTSAYEKYAAMESGDYLKAVQFSFEPGGGELGGAFTLFGRTFEASTKATEEEKTKNTITQGWLDVRNIAGKSESPLGTAKENLTIAKNTQAQSFLQQTNDALVDTANIFLNQLAYEGFQRVLREINKGKSSSQALDTTKLSTSGFESLIQYGEAVVSEKLASVIKPHFDVRSDYDILSDLATCADKNNPSPISCVIDSNFSQAISEKLTVGEALKKGYLHGNWLVSADNKSENAYTLRNASILRKYRILPLAWEEAISRAATNNYQVTIQDLVSCFSDSDGYETFSDNFPSDKTWCKNLVDPNWVLKAPLNYCAKQGSGGYIINSSVSLDYNGIPASTVLRDTDYCADEQSCIKEKADGSCEVYGYCNEEKRTWKFSSETCEPVYNTCQTFTNKSDSNTVSFLENTLDYSTCSADNSGCKTYSSSGSYAANTNTIKWTDQTPIFLNNKVVSCDSGSESCNKLLRGKPGWSDVNYVMDANFDLNNVGDTGSAFSSTWRWPIQNGAASIVSDDTGKVLQITGSGQTALISSKTNNLIPKNLTPVKGWSYTLSVDVKMNSGSKVILSLGDRGNQVETSSVNNWVTLAVTASDINSLDFSVTALGGSGVNFLVRNLKLTPNNYYPGYSSYGLFPVYEKLLPNYLESTCYKSGSDYNLKDNAPEVCNNFARKCNSNEVGCELFKSAKDLFTVAAKANTSDYCDAQCVGYDTYIAKESYFYNTSADNIIPDKATSCVAENVGCASFTNLDAVAAGGEQVEYFSAVKQCIKPDTNSCADFYSWDNSQLKVLSLKKKANGDPFITDEATDNAVCNQTIYNYPISHPQYNPDCREFYSKSGKITYHSISSVVTCSENCLTYRLNNKNIDKTAISQETCAGTWDANNNSCYVCKNGGVWDAKQNSCIYRIIPEEATTCAAEEVSCREYNGNNGNSLKLMTTFDFEAGLSGFIGSGIAQSLESTVKNGHSLQISGEASVPAPFAKKDAAYIAKFMAKSPADVNVDISLNNADAKSVSFSKTIKVKGDDSWHLYEVNLSKLDHDIKDEVLKIKVSGVAFIDNLIINEITDRYYLIEGSSKVPDICYYDMSDVFRPNYNLGCAAYTDRAGTTHNLHQFSELCQNSAVGCEQMIQTNNSSKHYGYNVNLNELDPKADCLPGTPGCLTVKDSEAIYAVYDASKQCNKVDAGCSRLGYFKEGVNSSSWVDVYKKLLPDTYRDEVSSPLCRKSEVGCDSWSYGNGLASYFKNPGLNTCTFRDGTWYKTPVKRCDLNGDQKISGDEEKTGLICSTNNECNNKLCITDDNNYFCETTTLKTIGYGGAGSEVKTPKNSVALCHAESSSCGEYIDPVSKHVGNLIENPRAETIDNSEADGWKKGATYSQRIAVKPNKLYILQVDNGSTTAVISDFSTSYTGNGGQVYVLREDNSLGDLTTSLSTGSSILFYTSVNTYLTVYRSGISVGSDLAPTISLKEAIINYQLSAEMDTSSCNGVVNPDAGCVLFNARTQAGRSGLKKNIFNANAKDGGLACDPGSGNCNSNTIVKVSPDRICSRWLSCQTYAEDPITKEKVCYKMGECDKLNEKNECGNFLNINTNNRDITSSKNATGYALLNNWYVGGMKEVGQNTDAHFDFESNLISLSCSRNIDVSGKAGLTKDGLNNKPCVFDKNINELLVLNPSVTPTNYPAHGKGFIKVLNYYQISPLAKNSTFTLYSNQDYYINYLVNTKDSNAKASLLLTNKEGGVLLGETDNLVEPLLRFTTSAPNGWERRVFRFNIKDGSSKKNIVEAKIYLTSDTTDTTPGYVYFDDINIEPVLQTSANPKKYVAKDCRLYPGDDSTSCLSSNNNVIKDGLFGYCLQYDPLNTGVCLMWYPVDKISPITRKNQSDLGYTGKFPLYYCSEANGRFALVEKRKPFLIKSIRAYDRDRCDDAYPSLGFNQNKDDFAVCGTDYIGFSYRFGFDDDDNKDHKSCETEYWCVPKKENLTVYVELSRKGAPFSGNDAYLFQDSSETVFSNPNQFVGKPILANNNEDDISEGAIKNDDDHGTLQLRIRVPGSGGWYAYNGLDTNGMEKKLSNPAVKVYNYDIEPTEDSLNNVSGVDYDNVFKISCNTFSQLVSEDGDNMAWADRLSRNTIFATSTPSFFDKDSGLINFGRNREDVPFGSAVIPANYDLTASQQINLRNQYSKKYNETLFAGRPYGCTGSGCNNIGQCSLDPNVFCLYRLNDTEFNKLSCSAGGNGVCTKLWDKAPNLKTSLANLNNLFLKKYNDFAFSRSIGGYVSTTTSEFTSPDYCPTGQAGFNRNNGSCFILPVISNTTLKFKDQTLNFTVGKAVINNNGLYKLSFNTLIDKEQQPLKQIVIDWGDGIQVVTGLDNKPVKDLPHDFYHFYLKGSYKIQIKIFDNWGKYDCYTSDNSACSI